MTPRVTPVPAFSLRRALVAAVASVAVLVGLAAAPAGALILSPDGAGVERPRADFRALTANLHEGTGRELAQLRHVLRPRPDVVLLQEADGLSLRRALRRLGLARSYTVVQGTARGSARAETALLVKSSTFQVRASGVRLGYRHRPAQPDARYLAWARLRGPDGARVAVVSLHLPHHPFKKAAQRTAYQQMGRSYLRLVADLRRSGHAVLTGGDWNQDLAHEYRADWDPRSLIRAAGLRTNWVRPASACAGGTHRGPGAVDGFGFRQPALRLVAQGCLARRHSDHTPVWADFRFRARPRP